MPVPKKTETKKAAPKQIEEPKSVPKAQPPETKEDEDRIDFVNVKDLIKGMERQGKDPIEQKVTDVKETNGFHKKITDNGHDTSDNVDVENIDDSFEKSPEKTEKTEKTEKIIEKTEKPVEKTEKLIEKVGKPIEKIEKTVDKTEKAVEKTEKTVEKTEKTVEKTEKTVEKSEMTIEKTDSSDSSDSNLSRSNSLINGVPVQAPKPLPRSSISEGGSMDDFNEVPKPKPRTTTGQIAGYKVLFGSSLIGCDRWFLFWSVF